jgi:hypothetical protein
VTIDAWRVLKVAETVAHLKGDITLSRLADLTRARGGSTIEVVGNRRAPWEKETCDVDVEILTDGRITLSKEASLLFTLDLPSDIL